MLWDIIKAIILDGIPVAFFSYYLVKLLYKDTTFKASNAAQLKQELKALDVSQSNEDQQEGLLVKTLRKKFIKFGGGFYGVMSLITYIHIEVYQVIDFIKNFTSFADFIDKIGFSMIVGFFVEALMNFISAITWPIYWHKYLPIGSFWIWIVVAIIAHTSATRYALSKQGNNLG